MELTTVREIFRDREKYLNKEKCQRQVYQIHFAYTANEDGYIDRTTHAIMHPNEETLYYDAKLLCQYGMGDCNWITEVSETIVQEKTK